MPLTLYPAEDDYVCETCSTPVMSRARAGVRAYSLEGIVAKMLTEVLK